MEIDSDVMPPSKRQKANKEVDDTNMSSATPIMTMFLGFRDELDEHHDRRERIIKASRDITALSKKMYVTRKHDPHIHQLNLV
jgi:Translin family